MLNTEQPGVHCIWFFLKRNIPIEGFSSRHVIEY
jgi:hypothetical protein